VIAVYKQGIELRVLIIAMLITTSRNIYSKDGQNRENKMASRNLQKCVRKGLETRGLGYMILLEFENKIL
jgi:hypothetical protein